MACILSSSIGQKPGDGRRQFAIQQQMDFVRGVFASASNRLHDPAFEFAEISASLCPSLSYLL
jgi:hypothetical protein